jgi:multidrug efflux pump subunit AcrB
MRGHNDRRTIVADRSRRDSMNPIVFAMRRPLTVMVLVAAVALGSGLALFRMPIDIFPNLNLPVIYVAQS